MRVIFSKDNLDKIFAELRHESSLSWGRIAKKYSITSKTLLGWRQNKYTIPVWFINKIQENYKIKIPTPNQTLSESTIKSISGRRGGVRRIALYGNPGTPEGRSLGGKRSILTHLTKKDSFFVKKYIPTPPQSKDLAELVGILLGDGGINLRQVFITLNANEVEYAKYVQKLIKKLFLLKTSIKKIKNTNAVMILLSRSALVQYLETIGLNRGNKVKKQARVPKWINENPEYKKLCLRGLFDTDGCFFVDRHHIKDTIYCNSGVNFTNRSLPLLAFFKETLEGFGFHPRQTTKFSLFLRKEKEVIRFFKEIGTSNNKQLKRFIEYCKNKYGRVPKWS